MPFIRTGTEGIVSVIAVPDVEEVTTVMVGDIGCYAVATNRVTKCITDMVVLQTHVPIVFLTLAEGVVCMVGEKLPIDPPEGVQYIPWE